MKTIKFQSGQILNTLFGPVKVIRDKRSTFIWLYRGQTRLQGGLVEVIDGQEVFRLKDGYTLQAGGPVEEVYCTDSSVLPIDRSFKAIAVGAYYYIKGAVYPQSLFLSF